MKPSNLRVRSYWLPEYRNKDLKLPSKELKESWDIERDWRLILLRLRWGHNSYEIKVNENDELELVKLGGGVTWE